MRLPPPVRHPTRLGSFLTGAETCRTLFSNRVVMHSIRYGYSSRRSSDACCQARLELCPALPFPPLLLPVSVIAASLQNLQSRIARPFPCIEIFPQQVWESPDNSLLKGHRDKPVRVAESQYRLADYIFLDVEAVNGEGISTC